MRSIRILALMRFFFFFLPLDLLKSNGLNLSLVQVTPGATLSNITPPNNFL